MLQCEKCGEMVQMLNKNGICPDCELEGAAGGAPATNSSPPAAPTGQTSLATKEKAPIAMGDRGVRVSSFEDLYRFSGALVRAGLGPKNGTLEEKTAHVVVQLQTGLELGFTLMQSRKAVYVVDGRPGLYGEAVLALLRRSGHLKPGTDIDLSDGIEGEGDDARCWIQTWRNGSPSPKKTAYSVRDAKAAGLWNKKTSSGNNTPWITDPASMLTWRAVSRHCKLYWSDVTLGIDVQEVALDFQDLDAPKTRVLEAPKEKDPMLEKLEKL